MLRTVVLASFVVALMGFALAPPVSASEVILRAQCPPPGEYVESGTWIDSAAEAVVMGGPTCKPGSRSTIQAGAYAQFAPKVPQTGRYAVYVMWGETSSTNNGANAENVTFTITDGDGSRSVVVNQRGKTNCPSPNLNTWIAIGEGVFTTTGSATIRLTNTADGQCYNGASKRYANLDAVRLLSLAPVPTTPTSWGLIKSRY